MTLFRSNHKISMKRCFLALVLSICFTVPAAAQNNAANTIINAEQSDTEVEKKIIPIKIPSGALQFIDLKKTDVDGTVFHLLKDTTITISINANKKVFPRIGYFNSSGKELVYSRTQGYIDTKNHIVTINIPSTDNYTFYIQNVAAATINVTGSISYDTSRATDGSEVFNLEGETLASALAIPSSTLNQKDTKIFQNKSGKGFSLNKKDVVIFELDLDKARKIELGYIDGSLKQVPIYASKTDMPIVKISIPNTGTYKFYVKNIDSGSTTIVDGTLSMKKPIA